MISAPRTAPALAMLLGAATAFTAIPLVGYTAAIPAPMNMFLWMIDRTSSEFASFAWDLIVVFGPTIGLLLLASALVMRRVYGRFAALDALSLGLGAVLSWSVLIPLAYQAPFARLFAWWASAAEVSIVLACLVALGLFRRRNHEDPSGPNLSLGAT